MLGWNIRRNLSKINYRIHTDAIKENMFPPELTKQQVNLMYASEADILNMALFGKTAKDWRMERSLVKDVEIKVLLKSALTDQIDDRALFMKGIDVSYFYEGYSQFRTEEL